MLTCTGWASASASKGCIVEDRGALRHASRSGGAYIFSDTEVGALPLVLLGTENAMSEWLLNNKHCRIENRLEDLPDIYIGVTRYKPGSRFRAISPVGDTATELTKQLTSFSLAGAFEELHSRRRTILGRAGTTVNNVFLAEKSMALSTDSVSCSPKRGTFHVLEAGRSLGDSAAKKARILQDWS
ncbi:MAG TPA: hypothetical protein VMX13_13240 [Sedimentisphaerales bacterium]|nr:hypothetical protein [Sedimentisphaerales bacterium]